MPDLRYDIVVDTRDADHELFRLQRGPTFENLLHLESTLARQFAQAKFDVHVQTGSLLLSGKMSSHYAPEDQWTGQITFGGFSPGGIHDPVDYAYYEASRGDRANRHGTSHNFMMNVDPGDRGYVDAILAFLRGSAL